MNIDVKYIAHSGYSVSLNKHYLLFDYFYGDYPGNVINHFLYPAVFSSHSHSDHFNKKIFALADKNPATRIFLSDDIKAEHDNAIYLSPYKSYKEKDIEVYAFGSTDMGVSFAVLCEGISIFHAGDLNYWSWKKESTDEEISEAYEAFDSELKKISAQFDGFDIAFFPVDPRMQKDYDEGALIFLERFNVSFFFPMHFGQRFSAAKEIKEKYKGHTAVYAPHKAGETFTVNI